MEVTHGREYVYSIQYHIVWCEHRRTNQKIYSKSEKEVRCR